MGKEKFIYNTHTLRYEKVEESFRQKTMRFLGFVCMAVFTAFLLLLAVHRWLPSPEEKLLQKEISKLETKIQEYNTEVDRLSEVLQKIQERDAYTHRMVFGMDPIDQGVWEGGVGGHDQFENLRQYQTGDLLIATNEKMEKLKRQMDIQSRSLDTIMALAGEKEKMLASIPSIKPVRSDKLARNVKLLSGFGYRIHPIFKVPKMHYGIDFTAPAGTPIQATGAGRVSKTGPSSGYGNQVIIDHGYGYQTIYAHMKTIDVKVGQEVKRGQKIGTVGSTGTSTAPHCHYEVVFKGEKVNPINYCMDGLTPEEYQEMVKAAETANQSFD